jgi:hypothetical protein
LVSGGTLELQKCFYYLLSWKFDEKANPVPSTIEEQSLLTPPISILHQNSVVTITQKAIKESHSTLGVTKSVIGEDESALIELKAKNDHLGRAMTRFRPFLARFLSFLSVIR